MSKTPESNRQAKGGLMAAFRLSLCMCVPSILLPVMPDVLHVLVILQHIQELGHAADIVLAGHGDVVLRNHLDLRAGEGIALGLQCLDNVVEAVGISGDLEHRTVGLHILRAGIQPLPNLSK